MRDGRCVLWGSPYLDVHGEDDVELDRGSPMYLEGEIYGFMEEALLGHQFDNIIMQSGDAYRKAQSSRML